MTIIKIHYKTIETAPEIQSTNTDEWVYSYFESCDPKHENLTTENIGVLPLTPYILPQSVFRNACDFPVQFISSPPPSRRAFNKLATVHILNIFNFPLRATFFLSSNLLHFERISKPKISVDLEAIRTFPKIYEVCRRFSRNASEDVSTFGVSKTLLQTWLPWYLHDFFSLIKNSLLRLL